jgi:c(7)-type cytochrome triheme protein
MLAHSIQLGWLLKRCLYWVLAVLFLAGYAWAGGKQVPLAKDGVHDVASPAIRMLQEPADALATLPSDVVGNQVRWVKALELGNITPRANIFPGTTVKVLDLDVIMPRTAEMPMVKFPHRQHTEWLDCSNCHEKLFISKAGANKAVNMFEVLQGEYCGLCHGAVAFPLTECNRCHSVVRK